MPFAAFVSSQLAMYRSVGAMVAAMSGNGDEVRCSNCGHLLSPAHVGPCPKCGGTAKNFYVSAVARAHATAHVEATVIRFGQLPQALQEKTSTIFLRLPQLLPAFIIVYVLTQIANSDGLLRHSALSFAGLGFLALLRGYNVDSSFKVSDSGKVINTLKLTKKNHDDDKK